VGIERHRQRSQTFAGEMIFSGRWLRLINRSAGARHIVALLAAGLCGRRKDEGRRLGRHRRKHRPARQIPNRQPPPQAGQRLGRLWAAIRVVPAALPIPRRRQWILPEEVHTSNLEGSVSIRIDTDEDSVVSGIVASDPDQLKPNPLQ
jgi:hypothetical protein